MLQYVSWRFLLSCAALILLVLVSRPTPFCESACKVHKSAGMGVSNGDKRAECAFEVLQCHALTGEIQPLTWVKKPIFMYCALPDSGTAYLYYGKHEGACNYDITQVDEFYKYEWYVDRYTIFLLVALAAALVSAAIRYDMEQT